MEKDLFHQNSRGSNFANQTRCYGHIDLEVEIGCQSMPLSGQTLGFGYQSDRIETFIHIIPLQFYHD